MLDFHELVRDGRKYEPAAMMRTGKMERTGEYDVEPVRIAELVAEQLHAGLGGCIRSERVRQVGFLVQTS